MKIKDLIPKEEVLGGNLGIEVKECTADYKKAREDSLLFLLPGVNFDTYTLSDKYVKAKPRAIVTERAEYFEKAKLPIIRVRSARKAFALANHALSAFSANGIKLIGITGTNGKTSTATILRHILEYNGIKVGFIGTGKIEFGTERFCDSHYSMTSPDPDLLYPTLARMKNGGAEAIVMETSSHALALEKLAPLKFDIGVFTGLSHEHLDFHKTIDEYFESKEKLITNAKRGIINIDDPRGRILYEKYSDKSVGIGVLFEGDIRAREIDDRGFDGISYILKAKNHMTRINLPLPGIYNTYNSLLAFSAARELELSPKEIKDALSHMPPIEGRYEIVRGGGISVIIDYAHTPFALENLLKNINTNKNIKQNIILVFGCGGERDKGKRPMMASIAKKYASSTIVTTDNSRGEDPEKIISDIVSGFGGGGYGVIVNRADAIRYAIKNAKKDDIVLIAGKGHERYICDAEGYHDFDEREIVAGALAERA